jgi:hypothetical protein
MSERHKDPHYPRNFPPLESLLTDEQRVAMGKSKPARLAREQGGGAKAKRKKS